MTCAVIFTLIACAALTHASTLAFDLERTSVIIHGSRRAQSSATALIKGGRAKAAVCVRLLEATSRRQVIQVEGRLSKSGTLALALPLDSVTSSQVHEYVLLAQSEDHCCETRVVHGEKMALLEELEAELLFSGSRSGTRTYPRALALVRASLEQKLR